VNGTVVVDGDEAMRKRPIAPLVTALRLPGIDAGSPTQLESAKAGSISLAGALRNTCRRCLWRPLGAPVEAFTQPEAAAAISAGRDPTCILEITGYFKKLCSVDIGSQFSAEPQLCRFGDGGDT
jgi:hypothetical protein